MPEYQIQAPDGNNYKIQGPEGASRDEIISRVSAKFPQAAKPKDAGGPSALGIARSVGTGALDVASGLGNPKELFREAYHAVTDWAGHTVKASNDLADWLSDKTGFYELKLGPGGPRLVGQAEFKREEHITDLIKDSLLSEKLVREPQTATGTVIKDVGEFTLGMATAGKLFGIANKTFQGGVSAWTVFDPQQGRLSDLINKYPVLRNPVTNFLKSEPGDTAMESRLKNTIEGVVGGKVAEGFIRGVNVLRTALRGQVASRAFETSESAVPGQPPAGRRIPVPGKPHITPKIKPVEQGQQEAKTEMAAQAAAGETPNLGEGVSKSADAVNTEIKGPKPQTPSANTERAFSPSSAPGRALGQLKEWWQWTKALVAPESLSNEAKQAGADIAASYADHMQHVEERFQRSPERKEFWATNLKKIQSFMTSYSGGTFKDPDLERARTFYKKSISDMEAKEKKVGVDFEAENHFLPHLFEDFNGVRDWLRTQKIKVPGFSFDLYQQAVKENFKPRFTNPEDIIQARQHAGDIAMSRIDSLKRLAEDGLAIEGKEGRDHFRTSYSTPDGKTYWVHDEAKLLLNRMFDEKSLWSDRSPIGSVYRGMVALKNNLIPVRLAFSLFHPLHVLTMHAIVASATRSVKAGEWMSSKYSEGSRVLKMLRGEIPGHELTGMDKQALQYLGEGGLILEQDPRYRTQALEKLRTEFVNGNPGALLHAHTGALQVIQNAIFKTWIPSLKGASYLADVRAALKAQPSLLDDSAARRVALRRIAKSVENRYGEMNYSTLFWNRMFRDVSVLSATSMGWQLGLFREYGGGAGQLANALGKIAMRPGNAKQIVSSLKKSGDLDKLIYVANYTTIAATLGGTITWAMTGRKPQEAMDFFAPKNGDTNPDGTPARVRTMFYPYEFAAMTKRVQHEGPVSAATEFIESKGTGIPSMLAETWTGVDSLGRQIRDPNGTAMQQVRQTINAVLRENYPISLQQKGAIPETAKQRMLDVAGLSKAPRYLQETTGEASIEQLWQKQYKTAETPFQRSIRSSLRQKLQAAVQSGDDTTVDKTLTQLVEQFHLRPQDAKRMVRDASSGTTSYQALFKEMREEDQKAILEKMPAEERKKYLPYAKRRVMAEFSE